MMVEEMSKEKRIMKSEAARKRRKTIKQIVKTRTENLYARLRKLRKSK